MGDGKPHFALGLCSGHYGRMRKGVDLTKPFRGSYQYVPTPGTAHERIRTLWGSAGKFLCIKCENLACDWAYDGTDDEELYVDGYRYSRWPEFYMPMCRKCHLGRDRTIAATELREYRDLKRATGLTFEQMLERYVRV
jgi:hypothetical protein